MSVQEENQDLSEKSEDVEEIKLEGRVREWLDSSGKKSELQAKLRAELFGAIQTELAFRYCQNQCFTFIYFAIFSGVN